MDIRILIVCNNVHPILGGGAGERTVQMCQVLAAMDGVHVTLLTHDYGISAELQKKMNRTHVVALPYLSDRFFITLSRFTTIHDLVAQADIVHLMSHWTLINALVYHRIRRLEKPYVVCPAGSMVLFGRSLWLKKIYNYIIGRNIILNATRQIAITSDELPFFKNMGVEESSVEVIPNGIHLEAYQFRDDDGFRHKWNLGKSPFLLFLGRLNPIKGPDLLVEAFAQLAEQFPEHHLVLAGPDGDGMGSELIALANKFDVRERVHLIGFIQGNEKSQAMHAAEFLVIPSRHEAMSIVVLEAGATATPVIMTDQCGLDEVQDISGGIVVPSTVHGLAVGLETALNDPDSMKQMGKRLLDFTRKRFSWDVVGQNFISLFRTIVETKS